LALGWHKIDFGLTTKSEVPLTPGKTLKRQRVRVELTMPKKLQRAVKALKVTHARGGSPNSGVKIRMPVALPSGHVTNRINLRNLTAPKSRVPGLKKKWTITSRGFVPRIHVPGFAGDNNATPPPSSAAALRLAPRFRINSTLFRKGGKRYKSTMRCRVWKKDRFITKAPILGKYQTDTVRVHAATTARKSTKVQLVYFNAGANPANSLTKPKHGTLKPGKNGLFTYMPYRNFVGKDSFTYTAKDDAGESTSKVTIRVRKAPTRLKVIAPKKRWFSKRTNVRVRVNTRGAANGNVRLITGKRVLDRAKVKAGKARLNIKPRTLSAGKHKIRAVYAGCRTAQWSNAKFTLRVLKRR
ncbi:MAG TPA: Ig-like domain-containing protein, partial [Nocardioidaceae bacterium]|nr:Ig-like domain-containing protein [Nocardioidaceae bacterium]